MPKKITTRAKPNPADPQSVDATLDAKSPHAKKTPRDCTGPTPEFANALEFAKAMAQEMNLVALGSELLSDGNAKGASIRARMFETMLEYLYGKPASAAQAPAPVVQIIWDMPGPARERIPE